MTKSSKFIQLDLWRFVRKSHNLLVVVWIICVCAAKPVQGETQLGFVTKVDSPTKFEVGDLIINLTSQTSCVRHVQGKTKEWKGILGCNAKTLYVGTRVSLNGTFTEPHVFVPTQVVIFDDAVLDKQDPLSSMFGFNAPKGVLIRDALSLEEPRQMQTLQGPETLWWLDGYPMMLDSDTHLFWSPDSELAAYDNHLQYDTLPGHAGNFKQNVHPLASPTLLGPNMWVLYHFNSTNAPVKPSVATRMRVWPDTVKEDEKAYDALFNAAVVAPDYAHGNPGSIQFHQGPPISIVPSKELQDEVASLGERLIPSYQKDLSSTDPSKIDFRFYVIRPFVYNREMHLVSADGYLPIAVEATGYRFDEPAFKKLVGSVVVTATGMVLVPDTLLATLQNEAQLSALLADGIVAIACKQGYRSWPWTHLHHSGFPMMAATALAEKAAQVRMGMRQMYLAGYDIREAPYVFSLEEGLERENPISVSSGTLAWNRWDVKHWYVSYTFSHISRYYRDADYSKLKRGDADYQRFLGELRKADPQAFTDIPKPMAR